MVNDENLYEKPEAMKSDRSQRDVKKNYAFHKEIGHNTERCVVLKDKIEMLIRAGHFKEFLDEPQVANREERPRQQSPERIREVMTIIGGLHVTGESRSACDRYAKEARNPPQIHMHRTDERPTKSTQ